MNTRTIVAAALAITLAASAQAQEIRGAWTADAADLGTGRIHMQLNRRHSNNGQTMNISSFTGLSESQILSPTQAPVAFSLRREAGTLQFEGSFKGGFGAGQFSFSPNPAYLDTIRSLGVSTESRKGRSRDVNEQLMHLAIQDVSTDFIRSMQAEGYNVSLHDYMSFRIFRITPELVRELRSLGYQDISASDLVASQIHKVTPQYIREMNAAGFGNMKLKELVATRIHRVTPEFAREMSDLGYKNLGKKDLTSFRIHKVTPDFIRELRQLGYDNIPAKKLVSMRIHRVTPEFIRELEAAGYSRIPVDKLISMRIHGVDAEFARKMNGM